MSIMLQMHLLNKASAHLLPSHMLAASKEQGLGELCSCKLGQ